MPQLLRQYKPENIYNADETGLFWRLTPQKSLVFKNEKCFGGKKAKERITVLCAANMAGNYMNMLNMYMLNILYILKLYISKIYFLNFRQETSFASHREKQKSACF